MPFDNRPYDPKEIELETYKKTKDLVVGYWNDRMFHVLNNFFFFFLPVPGGDTYYGKFYRNNIDRAGDLDGWSDRAVESSRLVSQTCHEFIEEVEKTAQEISGSLRAVREITKRWQDSRSEENCKACFEVLVPIYIRLRQEGYSRHDLNG